MRHFALLIAYFTTRHSRVVVFAGPATLATAVDGGSYSLAARSHWGYSSARRPGRLTLAGRPRRPYTDLAATRQGATEVAATSKGGRTGTGWA